MTHDDVDDAIQALHNAQRAAFLLSMRLKAAGDDAGATAAQNRADRLQTEIDNAINKELDEWEAGARPLLSELNKAAKDAQTALDDVKQDVANAQQLSSPRKALNKSVALSIKFCGSDAFFGQGQTLSQW